MQAVRENLIGLEGVDPDQRATVYRALGLRLTYHPEAGHLEVESRIAWTQVRVGGANQPVVDWRLRRWADEEPVLAGKRRPEAKD